MKLPRFRFSIFTLLVFTAVIAVGLMLYQRHVAWQKAETRFLEIVNDYQIGDEVIPELSALITRYPTLATRPQAMGWVALHGDVDLCRQFLEAGANPREFMKQSEVPVVLFPLVRNESDMVQLMIQYGADVKCPDISLPAGSYVDNTTLLHVAARFGAGETCKVLLDNGVDVNSTNDDLATPLHYAGDLSVVRLLLEHGAKLTKDKQGQTPYDIFVSQRDSRGEQELWKESQQQIIDLLEQHLETSDP